MIGSRLIKEYAKKYDYEIWKTKKLDGIPIREIDGISFSDFLDCFCMGYPSLFFIQIGAHDGFSNHEDPLRNIVWKYNLHGLLVEPQLQVFKNLLNNYGRYAQLHNLEFENAAIGKFDGVQKLYTIKPELEFLQYTNQSASFYQEHILTLLKKHLKNDADPAVVSNLNKLGLTADECITDKNVPTLTFDSLLKKHNIQHFNILYIDAEGFDYEIIKMASLEKYKPNIINYEHEHLNESDQNECWRYLRLLGYKLFTHLGNTCAFNFGGAV